MSAARREPCGLCGTKHQAGKQIGIDHAAILASRQATAQATSATATPIEPADQLVTAHDVEALLPSRWGGLVLCPWGGVMPVVMPYRDQVVVADAPLVREWWLHHGRDAHATARALSVDLAWITSPAAVATTVRETVAA